MVTYPLELDGRIDEQTLINVEKEIMSTYPAKLIVHKPSGLLEG